MGEGAEDWKKEWAMKWLEGSILSYVKGRITLAMLLGRIRRALESYSIRKEDVRAILSLIQDNPAYLPSLTKEEKESKVKTVLNALEGI